MESADWSDKLAEAIASKIAELSGQEIVVLDIGVFPWHGTVELSAFLDGDSGAECFEDDVASWPLYNFSAQHEGRWPEVDELTKVMRADYAQDPETATPYFAMAATAAKSSVVAKALKALKRSPTFRIQLVHPDTEISLL